MKEIFSFNYNNVTYYLLYDQKFIYAKKENDEISYDLDDVDIKLIDDTLHKILNDYKKSKKKKNIIAKDLLFYICLYFVIVGCLPSINKTALKIKNYAKYSYSIFDDLGANLDVLDVVKLINDNPNLSIKEKELFSGNDFQNMFKDVLPYTNNVDLQDSLTDLKIQYHPNTHIGISGYWDPLTKTIHVFGVDNIDSCDKSVLSHEFLHVFTTKGTFATVEDDYYFYEIINTLMNQEYFGDTLGSDNGYLEIKDKVNVILELLDKETIKKYHASHNINLIIDDLCKLIPDRNMAKLLINKIEFFGNWYYRGVNRRTEEYNATELIFKQSLEKYFNAKLQNEDNKNLEEIINFIDYGKNTSIQMVYSFWNSSKEDLENNNYIKADIYKQVKFRTYFTDKVPESYIYYYDYESKKVLNEEEVNNILSTKEDILKRIKK